MESKKNLAGPIWLLGAFFLLLSSSLHATTYIVSNSGSDTGLGSLAAPWKTLARALTSVQPGDSIQLRGGRYCESNLVLQVQGTAAAWITIESYPGERAWILGGTAKLLENPGNWNLIDSGRQIYQSTITFADSTKLGGWLLDEQIQLLQYVEPTRGTSSDFLGPNSYLGPGLFADASGRICVRLQQNPNDVSDRFDTALPPPLASLDPNLKRILLFADESILTIRNSAYLRIRNLDLGPAYQTITVTGASRYISLEGCLIRFKSVGIRSFEESATTNLEIASCTLDMGFPPWVYWDDVKVSGSNPADASGWNAFACYGQWINSNVHHNMFLNCFDGILVFSRSRDSRFHHNIMIRGRDDAIDLNVDIENIEIDHNIIRHCYEGISILANRGATIGPAYIHHNMVDMTGYHRESRRLSANSPVTWSSGIPWGRHGSPTEVTYGSIWKIYNNTIIARDCNGSTTIPKPSPGNLNSFFNNIIVLLSHLTAPTSTLEASGGNVFWRTSGEPSLFSEPSGLEIDPGLDLSGIISEEVYDPSLLWDLYAPHNPLVATPGIPLAARGWPGTEDLSYRGAYLADLPQASAAWPLDESASDVFSNQNHGVAHGTPFYSTDKVRGTHSLQLNGAGAFIEVPQSPVIGPTKNFSVTAWIKPFSLTNVQGIITKLTDGSAKQFALSLSRNGRLQFDYEYAGNNFQLLSDASVPINQWSHLAATVDIHRTIRLYLNGTQVAIGSAPSETTSTTEPLTIGRWGGTYNSNYFYGRIDDIHLYGSFVLRPAQVAMLAGASPGYALWNESQAWSGVDSSPTSDPDHDGLRNLEEYAFGGNPLVSDPMVFFQPRLVGEFPGITFSRLRSDVSYLVESSQDLVTWNVLAQNPAQVGETILITDPTPLSTTMRRFFRLRLSQP